MSEPALDLLLAERSFKVGRIRPPALSILSPIALLAASDYIQELSAATVAAACVAPAVTLVDKAITRAQFHKMSLLQAKSTLTKELLEGQTKWNPALNITFKVYGATYLTANLTEAACHDMGIEASVPTTILTSFVNGAALAWKEKHSAELYHQTANLPRMSHALLAVRDGLTILSVFYVKHRVRQSLEDDHGLSRTKADVLSSFGVPMIAQLFSTPLHILAMDLHDNPTGTLRTRMNAIMKGYASVSTSRVLRVLPAFGLGSYVNDHIKDSFLGHRGP